MRRHGEDAERMQLSFNASLNMHTMFFRSGSVTKLKVTKRMRETGMSQNDMEFTEPWSHFRRYLINPQIQHSSHSLIPSPLFIQQYFHSWVMQNNEPRRPNKCGPLQSHASTVKANGWTGHSCFVESQSCFWAELLKLASSGTRTRMTRQLWQGDKASTTRGSGLKGSGEGREEGEAMSRFYWA